MTKENLSDWIDSQDVFLELKISPRTLQRWRINGMIPYSRLNGKCYYKRSDLVALLNSFYNGGKGKDDDR